MASPRRSPLAAPTGAAACIMHFPAAPQPAFALSLQRGKA